MEHIFSLPRSIIGLMYFTEYTEDQYVAGVFPSPVDFPDPTLNIMINM